MKTGFFLLVFLFAVDALACGEAFPPNGCSPQVSYVWQHSVPEYDSKLSSELNQKIRNQFDLNLEKYPMRALFDDNDTTFWMTSSPKAEWDLYLRSLTLQKVLVDGTCRMEGGDFQDQNRIQKLKLTIGKKIQTFLLKDQPGIQEFSLKRPIENYHVKIVVEKIYPGKKNNNTCITSLGFVTKEVGKWPGSLDYLFETWPGEYVYQSYNVFYKGKNIGLVQGEFPSFTWNDVRHDGYVTITADGSGFLFGHVSNLKGVVDFNLLDEKTHPKNMTFIGFDVSQGYPKAYRSIVFVDWLDEKVLCIGRKNFEDPSDSASFHLYRRGEGAKLKLLKEVEVPQEEVDVALESENISVSKFCPKP